MIVELATLASVGVIGYLLRGAVDTSNKKDSDIKDKPNKQKIKNGDDINEPVLSFIETFKKSPRRFSFDRSISRDDGDYRPTTTIEYEIADHLLGKVFNLTCRSNIYNTTYYGRGEICWMTQEESAMVVDFFKDHFKNRRIKLQQIKNNRARRDLMKIYVGN